MDKKFLKAKDIAQLWGITPRRVNPVSYTHLFVNAFAPSTLPPVNVKSLSLPVSLELTKIRCV